MIPGNSIMPKYPNFFYGWVIVTISLMRSVPHPLGKNFSHKGKRSRKNGKWIHTSSGNLRQIMADAVKWCQKKETA
jgi:hypothetical protein